MKGLVWLSSGEESHFVTLLGLSVGSGRSWAPSRENLLSEIELYWLRTGNHKRGVLVLPESVPEQETPRRKLRNTRGTEFKIEAEKYRLWEALLSLHMTCYSEDVNTTKQRTHIRSCNRKTPTYSRRKISQNNLSHRHSIYNTCIYFKP